MNCDRALVLCRGSLCENLNPNPELVSSTSINCNVKRG